MKKYVEVEELKSQDFQDYSKTDVEYAINNCPKANVVEVVRCFDCQNGDFNEMEEEGFCWYHDIKVDKCDFCSFGERLKI